MLKPEDYIIEGRKIKNNLDIQGDKDFSDFFNSKEECQPAFMPIDVPPPRGPLFVFGEYFLRKFYTVFDRDESVLGFSIANQSNDVSTIESIVTPYDDSKDEIQKMQEKTKTLNETINVNINIKNTQNDISSKNTKKENQTDGIKSDKKTSDFLSQSQNGAIVLPKSNKESEFFRDVLEEANNLNSDMSEQNTKEETSFLDEINEENLKKDNYFIEP